MYGYIASVVMIYRGAVRAYGAYEHNTNASSAWTQGLIQREWKRWLATSLVSANEQYYSVAA